MSDIRNRRCHCGRLLRTRHNDEIRKSEAKRDGYSAEKSETQKTWTVGTYSHEAESQRSETGKGKYIPNKQGWR